MKYRNNSEIVRTILESARIGTTKTKIMYRAYLSYTQLTDYIKILKANHLIAYDRGRRLYRTTKKGINSLNEVSEINIKSKVNTSPARRISKAKRRRLDYKAFYN